MQMKLRWLFSILLSLTVAIGAAKAEVVRCVVENPSGSVLPQWIEYEVNTRGTVVRIRDSIRTGIGMDWQDGDVVKHSASQLILTWDEGIVPVEGDWADDARVMMRLTRLANGDITITASPTDARVLGQTFQSRATCTP